MPGHLAECSGKASAQCTVCETTFQCRPTHVLCGIAYATDVDARQQRLGDVDRGERRKEGRVLADGSATPGQHLKQEPGDDGRRQVARCEQSASSQ